jgi:hypothetical protein
MTITFRFENRNALGRPTVQRTFISLIVAAIIMLGSICAEATSICGMKFNDINGNGIFDGDDEGIDGWTINLIGMKEGTVLRTVMMHRKTATSPPGGTVGGAGAVGQYCFLNLDPGTYTVFESPLLPGFVQIGPLNVGSVFPPGFRGIWLSTTPSPKEVMLGSGMDVVVNFGNRFVDISLQP